MINEFGERARFVVEDLGASPIATRFGVDQYPAIFVDEALVARPEDFYAWNESSNGRYVPWKELDNKRAFQRDLRSFIRLRLAGGTLPSLPAGSSAEALPELPSYQMTDIDGASFRFSDLRGKPVLVEMWAPWCPPCLKTLEWMKALDTGRMHIVGITVESKADEVRSVVEKIQPPARMVMGTDELLTALGGPPAVPTLLLANAEGRIVHVFYGAPADLHEQIEQELAKL